MKYYQLSGKGPRSDMEDRGIVRINKDRAWAIVCDGIGGQPGGKAAATICVNVLDRIFVSQKSQQVHTDPFALIRTGLLHVIDQFYAHAANYPEHLHMGCAAGIVFLSDNKVYLAWAGDVRIFLFRKNKLIYKSIPHNPIFDSYRRGEISLRQAERSTTNLITRAVSVTGALPDLELKRLFVSTGDRIVIGTDGMWNGLDMNDFRYLASDLELQSAWSYLRRKLKNQATDNYWGVVIEM